MTAILEFLAEVAPRHVPVQLVIRAAVGSHPDAATVWEQLQEARALVAAKQRDVTGYDAAREAAGDIYLPASGKAIQLGNAVKISWRNASTKPAHDAIAALKAAMPEVVVVAQAPIEVDLTPIADGQVIKVFWRGKPIYVNHRTKKQIEEAENVDVAKLPDPQPDSARVKPGHSQWSVLIGICTHLGCIPIAHQGPYDGYFCPCHGSIYDTSGRIRQGPAPLNLALPPYEFLSDTKIRIG